MVLNNLLTKHYYPADVVLFGRHGFVWSKNHKIIIHFDCSRKSFAFQLLGPRFQHILLQPATHTALKPSFLVLGSLFSFPSATAWVLAHHLLNRKASYPACTLPGQAMHKAALLPRSATGARFAWTKHSIG